MSLSAGGAAAANFRLFTNSCANRRGAVGRPLALSPPFDPPPLPVAARSAAVRGYNRPPVAAAKREGPSALPCGTPSRVSIRRCVRSTAARDVGSVVVTNVPVDAWTSSVWAKGTWPVVLGVCGRPPPADATRAKFRLRPDAVFGSKECPSRLLAVNR